MAEPTEKQKKNRFKPGQSGNPKGRPKGNVSLIGAIRADAEKNGLDKVVAKIRELAEGGDRYYIELLLKLVDKDEWRDANALGAALGGDGRIEIHVVYTDPAKVDDDN